MLANCRKRICQSRIYCIENSNDTCACDKLKARRTCWILSLLGRGDDVHVGTSANWWTRLRGRSFACYKITGANRCLRWIRSAECIPWLIFDQSRRVWYYNKDRTIWLLVPIYSLINMNIFASGYIEEVT